jgi:hypothetical protein
MVMSRDQNAGVSQSIKIGNSSFERVEEFRYLGTTLKNTNFIQEKNKSRLRSRNAYYLSVPNLLYSSLLFNTLKIKVYRSPIFPADFGWMLNLVVHIEGGTQDDGVL